MNYTLFVAILILIVAGWYAWHYYTLRGNLRDYARLIRQNPQENPGTTKELEGISSAVSSLISAFGIRYSILDDERSRLATVHHPKSNTECQMLKSGMKPRWKCLPVLLWCRGFPEGFDE